MMTRRCAVAGCLAAALVWLTPAVTLAAGSADPARAKDSAKTIVMERRRLEHTHVTVSRAQARLRAAAATARVAITRYDRVTRRLAAAEIGAEQARVALAAALDDVARMQEQVNALARATYISGGRLVPVAAILTAGGPGAILDQAATLGAVSQSQADLLRQLAAALESQQVLSAGADAAQQAVQRLAERAANARREAMDSLTKAHTLIHAARAKAAVESAELAAAWAAMMGAGDEMPRASARQGRRAVAWAEKERGMPYAWGGGDLVGPTFGAINPEGNAAGVRTVGFDCSGLTLFVWGKVGFVIDHYTGYQWVEGHHIDVEHMRPGDLVFFASDTSDPLTIHHVGIYVGGNRMIDAPHTGASVRYDQVFVPGFIGAVRP